MLVYCGVEFQLIDMYNTTVCIPGQDRQEEDDDDGYWIGGGSQMVLHCAAVAIVWVTLPGQSNCVMRCVVATEETETCKRTDGRPAAPRNDNRRRDKYGCIWNNWLCYADTSQNRCTGIAIRIIGDTPIHRRYGIREVSEK